MPGKSLLAEARSDDLVKALVDAREELKKEMEKYKFKIADRRKREQFKAKRSAVL